MKGWGLELVNISINISHLNMLRVIHQSMDLLSCQVIVEIQLVYLDLQLIRELVAIVHFLSLSKML